PVEMDAVSAVARPPNLLVIEGAAQAPRARYKGARAGSLGAAAAFSFYPPKNLGAFGAGGILTPRDDPAAEKSRLQRDYERRRKNHQAVAGTNSRLDTLQAAVLRVKLPHLDRWNALRRRHAAAYGVRLRGRVATPSVSANAEHVFHLYVVESDDRDRLQARLRAQGVETGIHYPVAAHLQEA